MDICTAVDVVNGTIYCCTLDAGHQPANKHRSDYATFDENGQVVQASHEWTEAA